MENSRIVRETVEYENGDIEERILRRKSDEKEFSSPGGFPWLWVGLLALGGVAFLAYQYKNNIMTMLGGVSKASIGGVPAKAATESEPGPTDTPAQAPGGYSNPPTQYSAETPRPMVNVDEYVGLVQRSGRLIG